MKKSRARFLRGGVSLRRFLTTFLLPLIVLLGFIYLLVVSYAVYTVVHPTILAENVDPSAYFLKFQDFTYKTGDGAELSAWYIPSKPGSPLILLLPGYGENRTRLLNLADKLHAADFSIVLPLLRGHDRKAEVATTMGWKESEDLKVLLDELRGRKYLESQKLGAWGMNISAFALLQAARQGVSFRALVLDSPFLSIEDMLSQRLRQYSGNRDVFLPALVTRLFSTITLLEPLKTLPQLAVQPWPDPPSLCLIVHHTESLPGQKAVKALESTPDIQIFRLAATREDELGGPSQDEYDQGVVRFFQKAGW